MAQAEYKIDLNTTFPMLHEQQARTIIGSTAGESPAPDDKPGIAYCHNVMPTQYGMTTVAYKEVLPSVPGLVSGEEFVDVRAAFGNQRTRIFLAWTTKGNVYVMHAGPFAIQSWALLPATIPSVDLPLDPDTVTIGTVEGISYIFYSNLGGFIYDELSSTLQPVFFNGLAITTTKGMLAANGYLVAYSNSEIQWSNPRDALDFVPSEVTGSGGGPVANLGGSIQYGVANSLGMLLYCEANVVAAGFTGNAKFPWRFKEIEDSKGGISLDLTAYQANSGTQFVFSKGGLQEIKISKAVNMLPRASDFLTGRRFEDYNETTKLYEITDIPESGTMLKKLKYVASRYLIMSYGVSSFTHAIVLDTALGKIGKLKTPHVDVFEYVNRQTEIAKENIAFLKADGQVEIVDFAVTNPDSSGVLILAKLQLTRTRFINLMAVDVENVELEDTISVHSQVSLDGKNFTVVDGFQDKKSPNIETWLFKAEGKNHGIGIIGKFNATNVQVTYVQSSRR